ncbi:MAG: tripartite tricarboxylate transporter TctB family protein [Betaproteobacteria bacterium]|nr:tripartite tricarboxylate transporter TctB family protein [Pseudomonadota bacterium]NBO12598.1 tripartite tricarboxylate transporter TctB family protein [Betaproteobacteria bacterium]NBO43723.1 tripartite tricarboxylate transporter TctB family protein [Betaproteobacteria bacterium]NBP09664.1 tripartite tricarboxylate transporter TctB family protein [Betaproteobacteria bacterium]NBP60965.1 tripartite tricarboxylate transporter TctB family protein [Betaproteobacteria bacterium]
MDQEPEVNQEPELSAASRRSLEIAVALFLFLLGLVVLADSWRIGASWAEDGPQAGYFPFYIGLIICITSLINFYKAFRMRDSSSFVSRQSLGLVLTVLLPTVVYVALIQWLGIYLASSLFIAAFMWRLGGYRLILIAPVAIGVSAMFFIMFEIWFTVPLPKGPLEAMLGLA